MDAAGNSNQFGNLSRVDLVQKCCNQRNNINGLTNSLEQTKKKLKTCRMELELSRKKTAGRNRLQPSLKYLETCESTIENLRKDLNALKENSKMEREQITNLLSVLAVAVKKFNNLDENGEIDAELFAELKKVLAGNQQLFDSCKKWKDAYGQLNVEHQILKRNYDLSGGSKVLTKSVAATSRSKSSSNSPKLERESPPIAREVAPRRSVEKKSANEKNSKKCKKCSKYQKKEKSAQKDAKFYKEKYESAKALLNDAENEIQRLKHSRENLQSRLDSEKNRNSELLSEKTKTQKELDDLQIFAPSSNFDPGAPYRNRINELETNLLHLSRDRKDLEEKRIQLETALKDSQNVGEFRFGQIQQLQGKITANLLTIQELEIKSNMQNNLRKRPRSPDPAENSPKEEKNRRVDEKFDRFEAAIEELNELKRIHHQKCADFDSLEVERDDFLRQLIDAKGENSRLRRDLANANAPEGAVEMAREWENEYKKLVDRWKQFEHQHNSLAFEHDRAEKEQGKRLKQYRIRLDQLIHQRNQRYKEYEAMIDCCRQEIEKNAAASPGMDNYRLKAKDAEIEELRRRFADMNQTYQTQYLELVKKTQQIETANLYILQMDAKNSSLKSDCDRLNGLKQRIDAEIRNSVAESRKYRDENAKLKKDLNDEREKNMKERIASYDEVKDLESQLQNLERLRSKFDAKEREIESLKKNLEDCKNDKNSPGKNSDSLKSLEVELANKNRELLDLRTEQQTFQDENEALKKEVLSWQEKLEEIKDQLAAAKSKNLEFEVDLNAGKFEVDVLREQCRKSKAVELKYNSLQSQLASALERLATFEQSSSSDQSRESQQKSYSNPNSHSQCEKELAQRELQWKSQLQYEMRKCESQLQHDQDQNSANVRELHRLLAQAQQAYNVSASQLQSKTVECQQISSRLQMVEKRFGDLQRDSGQMCEFSTKAKDAELRRTILALSQVTSERDYFCSQNRQMQNEFDKQLEQLQNKYANVLLEKIGSERALLKQESETTLAELREELKVVMEENARLHSSLERLSTRFDTKLKDLQILVAGAAKEAQEQIVDCNKFHAALRDDVQGL